MLKVLKKEVKVREKSPENFELLRIGVIAGEVVPILNASLGNTELNYPGDYEKRIAERALNFLKDVQKAAEKVIEFRKNFDPSPFLGHKGIDIKPYKYYLSILSPNEEKPSADEILPKFIELMEKIDDESGSFKTPSKEEKDLLKKLMSFFFKLSETAVSASFPLHAPEEIKEPKVNQSIL